MLRAQALLAPLILSACTGSLTACSGADPSDGVTPREAQHAWAGDASLQRIPGCPPATTVRVRADVVKDDETLWDLDNTRLPQHVIPPAP